VRRIETAIDIAAPPIAVWGVLVDFAAYPDWNPFIRRLQGEARAGARLEVTVQPPGGKPMTFRPRVLAAEPARELSWRGRVLLPGLFDGEHGFRLEAVAGGCRLNHSETFSGLLVPLFGRMLDTTERGFSAPHWLVVPMSTQLELLATARRKRELAQRLVQLAPGLSVADDRAKVIQHARLLEEEAAKLEAKAAEV